MSEAHRREKQPELVRRSILDRAAKCAAEFGLSKLTLQAVAESASVTKGGLLHHFASKQALIEAVFEDLLAKLDQEIDRRMGRDAAQRGCFTRAYIDAFFQVAQEGVRSPWAALSVSCMTDARLRALWSDWMKQRLDRHAKTDADPSLSVVRYAVDGIWLANLIEKDGIGIDEIERLRADLKRMTGHEATR